jgi:replicative DNA helicase
MEQNKIQEAARKIAEYHKEQQVSNVSGKKKGCLVVMEDKPPVADNTTLMLYVLKLRAVDEGRPSVFFSLGVPNVDIVNQLIAITTGIDIEKVNSLHLGNDEWKLIDKKLPLLVDSPLYVDDSVITLPELRMKMKDLADNGVDFVVIDHAQKIAADGMSTDNILDGVKTTAEQLGMTVIAVVD